MGWLEWLTGRPSPARFARQVIERLEQAGYPHELVYEEDEFCLIVREDGRQTGVLNLTNVYAEHLKLSKADRAGHVTHIARMMATAAQQLPDEFEDASYDLMPSIRSKSYVEMIRLQAELESGMGGSSIPYEEVGGHLAAHVVFDLPGSTVLIEGSVLEGWGTTFYEAMETARYNLQEREFALAKAGDGVYLSVTGDDYDASRLLLTELVSELEVKGEPVALVPNRDSLLITGSEDEQGLELVARIAEQALEEPRPISAIPICFNGVEWVDWKPRGNSSLQQQFSILETKSLAGDYATQKRLLDALYEKNRTQRYIAQYAFAKKKGRFFNYCVLTEGLVTLAPKTEYLVFCRDPQNITASARWERAAEVLDGLQEPVDDLYPPRFLVSRFPTSDQLARLGNELEL